MQYVPAGTPGVLPNFFGPGEGGFQDDNPAGGLEGTQLPAAVFNDILGNIMGALARGGVAPTPNRYQDLADAMTALAVGHGQCQLVYTSNVLLTLMPKDGQGLKIGGKSYLVPAGGMAVPNANVLVSGVAGQNLAASTCYLVYAKDDGTNSGVMIPSFWPVAGGHLKDTTAGNVGVEVRSNGGALDPSHTLIGMVATDAAGHFNDSDGQRTVLSWFNRRDRPSKTTFPTAPSTSSGTAVELSTSIRNSFLVWAGDTVAWDLTCVMIVYGTNQTANSYISFDGGAVETESSQYEGFTTGTTSGNGAISGRKEGLAEGLHYATVFGAASGTATWYGNGSTLAAVLCITPKG